VVGLNSEVRNGPMGSSRVLQERYCLGRRMSRTGSSPWNSCILDETCFSQRLASAPGALTVPILLLIETRDLLLWFYCFCSISSGANFGPAPTLATSPVLKTDKTDLVFIEIGSV
jgi:hypothetical protein